MKSMMTILSCILFLSTTTTIAGEPESKILSKKELQKIENRVQQELKNKNLSEDKKFYLNLLAARELYQYRFYDKASRYYQNALEMKVTENKSEAYINLIAIAIDKNDKDKVSALYQDSKNYFEKNPQFKTTDIEYYLKTLENYLPSKNNKAPPEVTGFYGRFAHEENLINLIKSHDYQKAFGLLNPQGIAQSTNDFNITVYDSLNVLVNRKDVKTLYCNKQYKQYPDSFAMSTIICSLLNDYLDKGKFEEKHLKLADLYFKENGEKKYIFDMVNELNEKK